MITNGKSEPEEMQVKVTAPEIQMNAKAELPPGHQLHHPEFPAPVVPKPVEHD